MNWIKDWWHVGSGIVITIVVASFWIADAEDVHDQVDVTVVQLAEAKSALEKIGQIDVNRFKCQELCRRQHERGQSNISFGQCVAECEQAFLPDVSAPPPARPASPPRGDP